MSRSGYVDDMEDVLQYGRFRGVIASATRGKRGQQFFRDLITALDAMPVKELGADAMVDERGCDCALAALSRHRGGDPQRLDPENHEALGKEFNIASQLAQEVMFMNDDYTRNASGRWLWVREWAQEQIKELP